MKCSLALLACLLVCGLTYGADIVVDAEATGPERYAARELQGYLRRVFGEEFPIVSGPVSVDSILVGYSRQASELLGGFDFSTLKPDEIMVKSVGKQVVLVGQRPRGTIYAVQEFLERGYGVRFLTARVDVVPKRTPYHVPQLDIRYVPPFLYREVWTNFQRQPRFSIQMRLNGTYSGVPFNGDPLVVNEDYGEGVKLLGFVHTFSKFVPPSKFFGAHPEYFGEYDGVRRGEGSQPCLTSPGFYDEFMKAVRRRLASQKHPRILSVSQNDGTPGFCTCSSCRALRARLGGNATDYLLHFVNQVAAELEKDYPDLLVETLAYVFTAAPPKVVRPRRNVLIRLCSMGADLSRPLGSAENREFRNNLLAWEEITSQLFVWNYMCNFTNSHQAVPSWHVWGPDHRFFAEHRTVGVFENGADAGSAQDLGDLRFYVLCKLLWNPQLDVAELIDEFCVPYYGAAAPHIKDYIRQVTAAKARHPGVKVGCYDTSTQDWLTAQELHGLYACMQDARKAVRGNESLVRRVEAASLSVHIMMMDRYSELKREPLFGGLDWKALLVRQLEVARRPENLVTGLSEGEAPSKLQPRLERLIGIFEKHGVVPEFARGKNVALYALGTQTPYYDGVATVVPQAGSAVGKVVRIATRDYYWLYNFYNWPVMKASVYAEVRCDHANDEDVLEMGIYDKKSKKQIALTKVKAARIAGEDFQWVKLFTAPLKPVDQLYLGPLKNEGAGNLWVDRIMVVEED